MVAIVPYNPLWTTEFKELAAALRTGLGDLALRIDHIGSTAVPGLDAKDVIDIQITIAALDERVVEAMTLMGYQLPDGEWRDHCPPGGPQDPAEWSKLYFNPPGGQRRTNTHVRVQGRANQRYALLFRDYLRTHPNTAAAYDELKRRLAANLGDTDSYPEVKDPAVDLIYFAAEAWAAANSWQPGPADA
jgi:GrpB-like predicted nucleotidyltransferase (UPF0157 family)